MATIGSISGFERDYFCSAQPAFVVGVALALRGVVQGDEALAAVDPGGLAALLCSCVCDGLLDDAALGVVRVDCPPGFDSCSQETPCDSNEIKHLEA